MTTFTADREPGTGNPTSVPGSQTGSGPITDAELQAVAVELYQRSGQVPRVVDIAQAAGGVRKARAVAARQAVVDLAAKDASIRWIHVSPEFEHTVRALLGEFLCAAHRQCEAQIAERLANSDDATRAAQATATTTAMQLDDALARQQKNDEVLAETKGKLEHAQAALDRARRDARRYRTLATERKAMIDALTTKASS